MEYYSRLTSTDAGLLGISVHYLSTKFMQEVKDAADYDRHSSIHDIEEKVIRAKGTEIVCQVDMRIGASYVHCLSGEDDVGKSNIMLSYAWEYEIGDIIDTLVEYCDDEKLDPKRTYIWLCCLSINQHRAQEMRASGTAVDFGKYVVIFQAMLTSIGHLVPMMTPWDKPTYLTRVWCIFEMYCASLNGCSISLVMSSRERKRFVKAMKLGDVGDFFTSLAHVDIRNAEAKVEADKDIIFNLIEDGPGFDKVNSVAIDAISRYLVRCYMINKDGTSTKSTTDCVTSPQQTTISKDRSNTDNNMFIHSYSLWYETTAKLTTCAQQSTTSNGCSNNNNSALNDLELLGISVHYLSTTLLQEVKDAGYYRNSKIYEIEEHVIRGKGTEIVCPVDKCSGAAYVHCLSDVDDVGKSNIMLSYAWGYEVGDIVDTLVGYCDDEKLDLKRTYVWICCLCINQHRVQQDRARKINVPFGKFRATFESRVRNIGHILPMMAPWEKPVYLTRVWCVFEMYTASENGCRISIAMPPKEKARFLKGVNQGKMNNFFIELAKTDVRDADATIDSDKDLILNLVARGPGYDKLNSTVIDLVSAYLVSCFIRKEKGWN